mgnify:CR=1 FL=1
MIFQMENLKIKIWKLQDITKINEQIKKKDWIAIPYLQYMRGMETWKNMKWLLENKYFFNNLTFSYAVKNGNF